MKFDFSHCLLRGFIGTLILCIFAPVTKADKITLINGDSLRGKVISLSQGKLIFESGPLGQLTIELNQIRTIQTDDYLPILLPDYDRPLQVRLGPAPRGVYLEGPAPKNQIDPNNIIALGDAVEKILQGPDKSFKWTGDVELGLSGRSGNTERIATLGKARLEAKNPDWTMSAYVSAIYAEQERYGVTRRTDDEIKGGARLQRMITDGISAYVKVDAERDKIEKIKLRGVLDAGLGICWLDNERLLYENRLGFGYQQKEYENNGRIYSAVGELTSDLRYKANDHIDLSQETTWIPDFNRQTDWRLRAESAATIYLDNSHRFFIKSGLIHDYDNHPTRNVERLDMYYFTNLGYKF
ncbi:MAG: hypothetical protein AMJ79_05595 [Phycisphaerae bacterium SM23_30]|nr:MAG: hypothetical protein AMJ79_05595 [Phycisphaerae bacterium SM23_30]